MGEVYRAVDTRMYRRPVALKLLSEAMGADPRALQRFDLEIATAANLRHPNIVQIYDRGEHEGRRYFSMELLEGRDLSAIIKERDLRPLDALLEIVVQLCDALDYAHAQGVVHRDIKPANILVITRGGTDHVKLVDFGIVHVARADHTRTVVQPGTMLYMSPEQLKDEAVAPRSDLFSLGIVAYELCSGVHPFKGKTEYLTSSNIMFERHPPLRTREPRAPEALEKLFDRLLDKDRDARPAAAGEVAEELRKIVRQLRAESSDTAPPSFGNLDEMTGPMVERIVHWAKGKETQGATIEALEAYKRAILLAPNTPWLHTQVARLEEQLTRAPAPQEAAGDDASLRTSSRNRHREAFVRERLVEADAALDDGELDRASSIAASILRQYPDEAQALALMDRIVLITDRGVPLKDYRKALRTAREALAHGDVPSARRSCDAAVALWPDDDEVITLGREIEKLRQVELAKALRICDELLEGAAAGRLDDASAAPAVAKAREAILRAEEMGADASQIGLKRDALDRVLLAARQRIEERERTAREAEEARRAEVKQLMADAVRRLAAAERATGADAAAARAALADVRAAVEGIARADALGADAAAAGALRARATAATRALEDRIASEEARQREIDARLEAIASSLAQAERYASGGAEDAARAEELLRAVESDIAWVVAGRPSAAAVAGLRATAATIRAGVAQRRREEDERRAEEERARRAREEKETRERLAREAQARAEREKAAARAERLRVLLAEARSAFKEADDLAGSIETEADVMQAPLDAARHAAEAVLAIEPDQADAQALLARLAKLSAAAAGHAEGAALLREEARRRRRDEEARRKAERRAALKKWVAIGGGVLMLAAVAAGGYRMIQERQRRGSESAERVRRERIQVDRAEAARGWTQARAAIAEVRSSMGTIDSEAARARALDRCDELARTIAGTARLDPSSADREGIERDLSALRTAIERVVVAAPPAQPESDLPATLARIQSDLEFAGRAPSAPLPKVEEALKRAEGGIALANGVLREHPDDSTARALLKDLQTTRSTLEQRRRALLTTPVEPPKTRWREELKTAGDLVSRVESQLRSGKPLADPPAAIADCRTARGLVERVLRDDPSHPEAGRLSARIANATAQIERGKLGAPLPPPPSAPAPDVRSEVTTLLDGARKESLGTEAGLRARIEADRKALDLLDAATGDWVAGARRAAQTDLDGTLVVKLFLDFRRGMIARDLAAVRAVYPSYPGAAMLEDAREIEFDLSGLDVEASLEGATATQTLKVLPRAGSWQGPFVARYRFAVARRGGGFVIAGQKPL